MKCLSHSVYCLPVVAAVQLDGNVANLGIGNDIVVDFRFGYVHYPQTKVAACILGCAWCFFAGDSEHRVLEERVLKE